MIDVKQAVQAAREFLVNLYHEAEIRDVLVEEVELSEDSRNWLITLGFSAPKPATVGDEKQAKRVAELIGPRYERWYKLFTIDSETGEVKSMKIRTISWSA
jgi:hypothetical protein